MVLVVINYPRFFMGVALLDKRGFHIQLQILVQNLREGTRWNTVLLTHEIKQLYCSLVRPQPLAQNRRTTHPKQLAAPLGCVPER